MIVHYSRLKKELGLEYKVIVPVPKKIARRITVLATELKDDEKTDGD